MIRQFMILKECCFTVLKLFSLKFWKLENLNEILVVFKNVYQVKWSHNFFTTAVYFWFKLKLENCRIISYDYFVIEMKSNILTKK